MSRLCYKCRCGAILSAWIGWPDLHILLALLLNLAGPGGVTGRIGHTADQKPQLARPKQAHVEETQIETIFG